MFHRGFSLQIHQAYSLTMVEKETLKIFLNATLHGDKMIILSAQEISEQINLSRPRAYAILTNLVSKDILEKFKRKGFILTQKGEELIHELNHREKVLETYMYQVLKLPLDKATDEASNLSLYASSFLINTLCDRINMPKVCPHGIPIDHNISSHS